MIKHVLFATAMLSACGPTVAAPDYRLDGSIKGPDKRWDYLSIDPAAHRLYIGQAGGVTGVDVNTGKVTPQLTRSEFIHGVIPIGDTGNAAAANGATSSVTVFHGASGATVAEIKTGAEPDALAYEPVTRTVVSFNKGSHDATIIDVASNTVAGSVQLDGKPEFPAPDGRGLIYDTIEDHNEIVVLDVAARRIVRRIPLTGCDEPSGLAYDRETGLLIAACRNERAKVIDAASGRDVATLKIGPGPDAVMVDETRRLAFIPCGGDGTLSVISLGSPATVAVVQTVKTKKGVRTGAVDPATGTVYLASSDFTAEKNPGGHPSVAPGTFRVLMVSPN